MVLREDRPDGTIVPVMNIDVTLGEPIVRGQKIDAVTGESLNQETPPTSPTALITHTTSRPVDDSIELQKEGVSMVDTASAAAGELSTQLIQGNLLNRIEANSGQPATACLSVGVPAIGPQTTINYLASLEDVAHEEPIIPKVQPMLSDETDQGQQEEQNESNKHAQQSSDSVNLLDVLMANMSIDDVPKTVNEIEQQPAEVSLSQISVSQPVEPITSEEPEQPMKCDTSVAPSPVESNEASAVERNESDSQKLGSTQDVMKKLSSNNTDEVKTEESNSAAPVTADSPPVAECVREADDEVQNEETKSTGQESVLTTDASTVAASITGVSAAVASTETKSAAPAKATRRSGVKPAVTKAPIASKAAAKPAAPVKAPTTSRIASKVAPTAAKSAMSTKSTAAGITKPAVTRPAAAAASKIGVRTSKTTGTGSKAAPSTCQSSAAKSLAPKTASASSATAAGSRMAAMKSTGPLTKAVSAKPSTGPISKPASTGVKTSALNVAVSRTGSSTKPAGSMGTVTKKPMISNAANRVAAARTAASSRPPVKSSGVVNDSK